MFKENSAKILAIINLDRIMSFLKEREKYTRHFLSLSDILNKYTHTHLLKRESR